MSKRRAFSLIEFVMVIVIIGILVAIGVPLLMEAADAWLLQSQRKEMSESAKIAIDRMVREIRRATSITTAQAATLQFTDIDSQNITFTRSGATLQRTLAGTTNNLADNATSLTFAYYDASGNPTAVLADIRRIQINLSFSLGGTQISLQSQVSPRRLQ